MNVRLAKLVTTYVDHPLKWQAVRFLAAVLARARPAVVWEIAAGQALERLGQHGPALGRYAAARALARASTRRSDARWSHAAQFLYERAQACLDAPRVDDPLFACALEPDRGGSRSGGGAAAGRFAAEFGDAGLRLFGFVPRGVTQVAIELDGDALRYQNTGGGGSRPEFSFTVGRAVLRRFPSLSRLRVRAEGGGTLRTAAGAHGYLVHVPHGDGSLKGLLETGTTLDKKGELPPDEHSLARRRAGYLRLYRRARASFTDDLGRPLFLMYGTLLGCWRDGDLIPGDDDFDVGYVSSANDPGAVKRETFDVIERLVRAGFTVSFNRRGRLFRLADGGESTPDATARVHLDVRPLWFQDGRVWAHNHFSMLSSVDDWLPVETSQIGDEPVSLPRRTERFLEGHYGPGWRVPDPAFTYYREAIPEEVLATLARALIDPVEYRTLRSRLDALGAGDPGVGCFAADGWDDLYPLPAEERGGDRVTGASDA